MRTNPAWVDEKPITCCKRCGNEIYAGEEFYEEGPFCEMCGEEVGAEAKITLYRVGNKLCYEVNGIFLDWEEE